MSDYILGLLKSTFPVFALLLVGAFAVIFGTGVLLGAILF